MISNHIWEIFEWKFEDRVKNWSLISPLQTEIGILHNFDKLKRVSLNFRHRKDRQEETNSYSFLDQLTPKKVPLVICATIGQKSGRFLMAFHCIKFLFWHFDIKLASADFSNNELSKQKHQPNKRPTLQELESISLAQLPWLSKIINFQVSIEIHLNFQIENN